MSLVEFMPPEFLQEQSAAVIQNRMMQALPPDIDDTEGGFVWDLTYPTALEKAEILQYHLIQTLKIMHPMWATGRWLDYHARREGLTRKPANKAYGVVTVTGSAGKVIPAGFVFSVPADGGVAAVDFETLADAEIPNAGVVEIAVQAVVAGKGGNVAADTVTIMREPMKGISKITNVEPITGGAEAESDDSLRQRIDALLDGKGDSYVGNDADYIRWAREVPGVGNAYIIPEWAGAGTVKIVLVDEAGLPANVQILQAVYDHIMSPGNRIERLAPIEASVTVVAPVPITVNYHCKLKLEPGTNLAPVIKRYKELLLQYYARDAAEDGEVKYVKVAAILSDMAGVSDFQDFVINGGTENIPVAKDEFPVTGVVEVEIYGD